MVGAMPYGWPGRRDGRPPPPRKSLLRSGSHSSIVVGTRPCVGSFSKQTERKSSTMIDVLAAAVIALSPVNLTDVPNIDSLPTCALEDGSDAASLPCVWTNDGNTWLTYADHSVLIVDDTVS